MDRDFFSAGGDSVLATRATAHIREHLAVQMLVSADFFQARTIRDLATLLRKQEDPTDGMNEAVDAYLAENQMEKVSESSDEAAE